MIPRVDVEGSLPRCRIHKFRTYAPLSSLDFDAKRARSMRTCPLLAFREPQGPEFDRRAQGLPGQSKTQGPESRRKTEGLRPGVKQRGEMVLSLLRACLEHVERPVEGPAGKLILFDKGVQID